MLVHHTEALIPLRQYYIAQTLIVSYKSMQMVSVTVSLHIESAGSDFSRISLHPTNLVQVFDYRRSTVWGGGIKSLVSNHY